MDSFLLLFALLCFKADFSDGVLITQWPKFISRLSGSSVEINCYQNETDYDYKYWYRQIKDEGPVLIGSYIVNSATNEKDFDTGFKMSGTGKKQWTLSVDVKEGVDGVYLCAASSGDYQAYFGSGTKLTVLDPEIKVSTKDDINVTIIKPSEKQLCEKKVTLVCVARNFYPDHVNIKWKIGEEEVTDGVATDPQANEDGKTFTISSRLRVHTKQWRNPKNTFKCILKFYDGTKYLEPHAEINGIEGGGFTRENYVNSSNMMKLGYGVFIAKSGLYGIIICVFILTKGCSGKRMN